MTETTNQQAAEELACAIHGETFLRMLPAITTAIEAAEQRGLERMVVALQDHWLWELKCNHEEKTDVAKCSCGKWKSEAKRSVGEAIAEWINHALIVSSIKPRATP